MQSKTEDVEPQAEENDQLTIQHNLMQKYGVIKKYTKDVKNIKVGRSLL